MTNATAKTQTATDKELLKAPATAVPMRTRKAPAKATPKAVPEVVDHDSGVTSDEQAKAPRTSIKWQFDGPKDAEGRAPQHGTSPINGLTYTITGSDKTWTAVVTGKGQKPQVLVENVSHRTSYLAAVKHAKGQQSA